MSRESEWLTATAERFEEERMADDIRALLAEREPASTTPEEQ